MTMETDKLFDEIAIFVREGRALLKDGVMMDMAGLDKRVMVLCDQALMLPQEVRAQYSGKLQELLDELTQLGKDLEKKRDALARDIRGVSQHKKAHAAYTTAEASDKNPEEK